MFHSLNLTTKALISFDIKVKVKYLCLITHHAMKSMVAWRHSSMHSST